MERRTCWFEICFLLIWCSINIFVDIKIIRDPLHLYEVTVKRSCLLVYSNIQSAICLRNYPQVWTRSTWVSYITFLWTKEPAVHISKLKFLIWSINSSLYIVDCITGDHIKAICDHFIFFFIPLSNVYENVVDVVPINLSDYLPTISLLKLSYFDHRESVVFWNFERWLKIEYRAISRFYSLVITWVPN